MQAPKDGLGSVPVRSQSASDAPNQNTGSPLLQPGTPADSLPEVADSCLEAWRIALKGDEHGAMEKLRALDKKYPNTITVRFMMGQVEERCGSKENAVKFYREAVRQSRFSSMYTFKLAEALRVSGKPEEAIGEYRRLISQQPRFPDGHLGLARALMDIDKNSLEAREEIEIVLRQDPNQKEALELKKKAQAKN